MFNGKAAEDRVAMITKTEISDAIKLAQKITSDNRTLTEPKNYSLFNNAQVLQLADTVIELKKELDHLNYTHFK